MKMNSDITHKHLTIYLHKIPKLIWEREIFRSKTLKGFAPILTKTPFGGRSFFSGYKSLFSGEFTVSLIVLFHSLEGLAIWHKQIRTYIYIDIKTNIISENISNSWSTNFFLAVCLALQFLNDPCCIANESLWEDIFK